MGRNNYLVGSVLVSGGGFLGLATVVAVGSVFGGVVLPCGLGLVTMSVSICYGLDLISRG